MHASSKYIAFKIARIVYSYSLFLNFLCHFTGENVPLHFFFFSTQTNFWVKKFRKKKRSEFILKFKFFIISIISEFVLFVDGV